MPLPPPSFHDEHVGYKHWLAGLTLEELIQEKAAIQKALHESEPMTLEELLAQDEAQADLDDLPF